MKKIVILFCALLCIAEVGVAASVNSAKLSAVENQIFGSEYKLDNDTVRVKRIEDFLYGKVSTSNDINARVKKICTDIGVVDEAQKVADSSGRSDTYYEKEDSTVEYPIIDSIEKKVLNQVYKNENVYKRLDRLEKKVYGKISNADLNNRVNNLRLAVLDTIPNNDLSNSQFDSDDIISSSSVGNSNLGDYDYNSYAYDDSISPASPISKSKSILDGDSGYNYVSPQKTKNQYVNMELSAIEQVVLKKNYTTDSQEARLNRLETKLFKRNFQTDSAAMRLERIAAATSAKKSSQMYDNNKLMRNLTTGAQIGGILLMILAMIL